MLYPLSPKVKTPFFIRNNRRDRELRSEEKNNAVGAGEKK